MGKNTYGSEQERETGSIYDTAFENRISGAWQRLADDLRREVPYMAQPVLDWMRQLSDTERPEDRLITPEMFPMFLLPRWLARTLPEPTGDEFEADVVYSTINGYYYIRLTDNLMDHETTVELEILPAASVFHTQFQTVYQQYFESGHPFWLEFRRHWFESAEFAFHDADMDQIDLAEFQNISSKKICAVKIPLAATAHWVGQSAVLPKWFRFCDLLGKFQQMLDDLVDWFRDATRTDNTTYFLSEAARRKRQDESVVSWVVREGFCWGTMQLDECLANLKEIAAELNSRDVSEYLSARKAGLVVWKEEVEKSLPGIAELDSILQKAQLES